MEAIVHDNATALKTLLLEGTVPMDHTFGRASRSMLHVAAAFGARACVLHLAAA
jgi:hypothetical protein